MPYQLCTNDESGLTMTFFTARPNLIINAFILENLSINVKADIIYINIFRSFDQNNHHAHIYIKTKYV